MSLYNRLWKIKTVIKTALLNNAIQKIGVKTTEILEVQEYKEQYDAEQYQFQNVYTTFSR